MTVEQIFSASIKTLSSSSESPSLDARIIISHVLSFSSSDFILKKDMEINNTDSTKIQNLVNERKNGKPIAYITGKRAFFKDVFFTDPNVLIPQPDTETLVEKALEYATSLKIKKLKVLDLCAGTGCIGISFAKEAISYFDEIELILSDISIHAFDCFSLNSKLITDKRIKVRLCQGNLFENIKDQDLNMILSNPPYIATSVMKTLDKDVLAQPSLALDGGEDGLKIIKKIIAQAPLHLCGNSALFMETGYDQKDAVCSLFDKSGFKDVQAFKDLGGNYRVVKGLLKE